MLSQTPILLTNVAAQQLTATSLFHLTFEATPDSDHYRFDQICAMRQFHSIFYKLLNKNSKIADNLCNFSLLLSRIWLHYCRFQYCCNTLLFLISQPKVVLTDIHWAKTIPTLWMMIIGFSSMTWEKFIWIFFIRVLSVINHHWSGWVRNRH